MLQYYRPEVMNEYSDKFSITVVWRVEKIVSRKLLGLAGQMLKLRFRM